MTYVKLSSFGGAIISDTPPPGPTSGQFWWENDTGRLFLWYPDGTSSQWVSAWHTTTTGAGFDLRPPTTTMLNYSDAGTGITQTTTYNASRGLSIIRTDGGTAGERVYFLGKAVPASSPWTATSKIKYMPLPSGSLIHAGGMALYNSTSHKFILFGIQNLNGTYKLVSVYYTGLNTYSADITTTTMSGFSLPNWFQIVESSTTYTFQYSWDEGLTWVTHGTATKATYFTADKVGVTNATSTAVSFSPAVLVQHYADLDYP